MAAFLSPEWVDECNVAFAHAGAVIGTGPDAPSFTMTQEVSGGTDHEPPLVRVSLVVAHGRVTFRHDDDGPEHPADVVVRLTWPDAVALSTGTLSAADAILEGRIRVRGDLSALAAAQQALAALQPTLEPVRARTSY